MSRRRDLRRFGSGPYVLGFVKNPPKRDPGFPYDLPVIAGIDELRLDAPITLLAVEAVRLTRAFLDPPERFIRAAVEDPSP